MIFCLLKLPFLLLQNDDDEEEASPDESGSKFIKVEGLPDTPHFEVRAYLT